jgi:hypothetical protein
MSVINLDLITNLSEEIILYSYCSSLFSYSLTHSLNMSQVIILSLVLNLPLSRVLTLFLSHKVRKEFLQEKGRPFQLEETSS